MPVNRIFFFASYHPINASSRYRGLYLLKALQKQIGLKYYFIYPGYAPINLFYYTIALLRIAFTKSKKYRIVLQKVQGDIIWNTTGRVIYAKDAVFLNNRKDVAFLDYDRSHPNNYDYHEVAYKADFINCTFRRNDDYRIEMITPSITINKVFAVNIKGCTFDNTNFGTMANKGGAIYTIKATYKAGNATNSNPCHFEGYTNANLSQLPPDKINTLQNLEATGKGLAVVRARHLLALNGVETGYVEPVFFPGGTANKKDPSPAHPNRPALRSNHFRLNPNPARESVSLYWNFAEILSPTPLEVEILNLQGKVLQRWTIDNARLEMKVLDISPLNTGAYILRVLQGENSLYHHKLLIE